jgi:hypothetical protein
MLWGMLWESRVMGSASPAFFLEDSLMRHLTLGFNRSMGNKLAYFYCFDLARYTNRQIFIRCSMVCTIQGNTKKG